MGSAKKACGFSVRRCMACAEAKSKAAHIPASPEANSKAAGEAPAPHGWENHFHRKMENLFHGHFALSHRQLINCVFR